MSSEKTSPLGAIADFGAAGQAVVPGVYAWAVTVAPAAWSRGGNIGVKMAALLAVASLLTTLTKWKTGSGSVAMALFVIACCVVWIFVPAAMTPAHLHPARGIAGMIGWGVFAFAAAAPSLGPQRVGDTPEGGLKPRIPLSRGDGLYLGIGVVLAVALQFVGWSITVAERGVFVRLVTVASGVAIIGVATALTTSRHNLGGAARPSLGKSLRRASLFICAVILLVIAGILFGFNP
jgi:hypothetical protein